uniref:Uncharacterized protein n=1 Tax=Romanomermis culicivorax TaxID=13658 RepID=A0A915I6M2_ROMCU
MWMRGIMSEKRRLIEVQLEQDKNLIPSQLYEKLKTDNPAPPGLEAVLNSRDRKQMANFKYTIQNKFRPMKDAICNLNTFIGITTNASESFNRVLKSWTLWREMPIDVAVLAFYSLF